MQWGESSERAKHLQLVREVQLPLRLPDGVRRLLAAQAIPEPPLSKKWKYHLAVLYRWVV